MLNRESKEHYHNMNRESSCEDLKRLDHAFHREEPNKITTRFLFFVILLTNLLINIDHGVIPACTTVLKQELGLTDVSLGTLGSLVYLGLTLGSFTATPVFGLLN